jgi:MFS family permease
MDELEAEEAPGFWKSNFGVMIISSGLWRIGGRMTWPFWALYVLQLGGGYFQIGLISAISSIFSLIPAFFGGYLADAIGRKKMISYTSILMAFDTVIYIYAPNWVWLLVARSMDAVLSGLRQPAFTALLGDSTKPENRSMSYGMWQAIPPIFGLASPYIIGVLMDQYGILQAQRWAYIILTITSGLAAIIRYRYLTETLPPEETEMISLSTVIRETLTDFRATVRIISNQMWILIFMGLMYQFGASVGSTFMVAYATEDVILITASQWGLINTASTLVGMIVSMPFAAVADRIGRIQIALISLFLTPFALLLFIYSRNFFLAFVSYILLVALGSMGSVASQALFIDFSPQEHRGRISALTSVIGATQNFNFQTGGANNIVSAMGNVSGGLIYDQISFAYPLYVMAGMIGASAILGATSFRKFVRKQKG